MARAADPRRAFLALLAVAVLGCASTNRLPVVPSTIPDGIIACPNARVSGTLTGDPADPRSAWVVADSGVRVDITWPYGFVATFEPGLVITSGDHTVTLKAGDSVSLGGGSAGDGSFAVCEIDGHLFLPSPNPG